MGSQHGKAGAVPGGPGGPPKLTHYAATGSFQPKGAALARTQREAYELDAADGVIDGKFYGAEIRLAPQDSPPHTAPAAANYHSLPAHGHATVPLHHNDPRPVYPTPQSDYHGYRGNYGSSSYCEPCYQPYGGVPQASSVYQQTGMDSVGRQGRLSNRAELNMPAAPCTGNTYQYTQTSYPFRPQSAKAAPLLPPSASLVPPAPAEPPKSFYDSYSRFAKVEFHTVAKSPYQHLLENQSRNIGQLLNQTGVVEAAPEPSAHRWMESGAHHRTVGAPMYQDHEEVIVPMLQPGHQDTGRQSPMARFDAIAARSQQAPAPASPAPEAPAWDQDDGATLGGFDADTSARKAFRRYDTDGNGFLDVYEFMAAMKSLGIGSSFKESQDAFAQIDVDGGGAIEEDEFVTWYVANFKQIRENMDPKKLAQNIFRKYDKDGSGSLDVHEFVGAMQELGLGYTLEDAQFVFDTFDNDGGGTIDEEEFVAQYYEQWLQQQG